MGGMLGMGGWWWMVGEREKGERGKSHDMEGPEARMARKDGMQGASMTHNFESLRWQMHLEEGSHRHVALQMLP